MFRVLCCVKQLPDAAYPHMDHADRDAMRADARDSLCEAYGRQASAAAMAEEHENAVELVERMVNLRW